MSKIKYPRRVVVTGLGAITPVGTTLAETWDSLLAGRSGAAELTLIDHHDFDVHFGCEVKNFEPAQWMDAREAKRVDRFTQLAMASAVQAMADSGLDMEKEDRRRCGIVYGSGIGGVLSMEEQFRRYNDKGARRVSPFTIPLLMVNCAPGMLAIRYGFQGVNYAPVTACATGTHALGLALRHIQWDEIDVAMAGGSEAGISILGLGGFSNMGALSTRNDDPTKASRPFDKNRDGFVLAEGAGAIILEELEHAKARGAKIYAEFLGYGMTDDAYHITAPCEGGEGGARGMMQAMEDSGITPDQVDYINAHGTSTPFNDKNETAAIKLAMGDAAKKVSVSSTKGCTGHMLGATGAAEFAFMTLAMQQGIIPPTINYETPDPECDLDYTPNQAKKREIRYALSNSLGFGGHNCTVCIGRYED
jgi:3-oxoacyl-[acyl-carrier-protein] synthase II